MAGPVTKEWLKEKSTQLQIPFAELLRGILLEDLLYKILPIEKPVRFVLENDAIIGEEAYQKGKDEVIALCFKNELTEAFETLQALLNKPGDYEWKIGDSTREKRDVLRVMVVGYLEDMKVPFVLRLHTKSDQPIYMELKSYRGLAQRIDLEYSICAPEIELAECICQILSRLELIATMDAYDNAYTIIRESAVDGRRVTEELNRIWQSEKNVQLLEKIRSYDDYRYMQKRWTSYCKNKSFRMKEAYEPNWEEVIHILCAFMGPVYERFCEDEIFIGDWMPELGRFM